jgi:hypothetical protein
MAAVSLLSVAVAGKAMDADYVETKAFFGTVEVSFDGVSAAVSNRAGPGLVYSQNGAVLVFTNTADRVAFVLRGSSPAGAVKIYSDKAFKLTLDGLSLVSPDGPAINIQSKKACYIVLPENTENVLMDGEVYTATGTEDAKGVLFSEGQLLFSGTGRLTVKGVCAGKHGVCSDDYVRILDGDLRVAMSKKSDGVHVNDFFRMDGGRLEVSLAAKGDAIDADDNGTIAINGGELSIRLDAADSRGIKCGANAFAVNGGAIGIASAAGGCNGISCDGALEINGGLIDVALTGDGSNAIKADRSITVNGGALTVLAGGGGSKGIKTDGDAVFNGGTLLFTLTGDAVLETVTDAFVYTDVSYCTGVKASNVVIQAGAFGMMVGGRAGRGFSADRDLTVNGGEIAIRASGAPTQVFTNAAQRIDVAATACMKAGNLLAIRGGLCTFSVAGGAGKGFSSNAAVLFDGGNVDLDLSGAPVFIDAGAYKTPVFCSGVKSDGTLVVSNGTLVIRHTGMAGKGLSSDGDMSIAGGAVGITVTGTNTPVYTSGVYTVGGAVSNYVDVGSASAVKCDGHLRIVGGVLTLLATGDCGKCVNVDGTLTVGAGASGTAPSISARTTGKQVKVSGGTPGGGAPGGGGPQPPDDNADYSNPKAIKAWGRITINGGDISIATVNSGGEGIESKDTITVNGGAIEAVCYDDCLNASTNITFNGGAVFCSSSNNDGIDANGTITVNGGVIASFGTTAPEEGFDCDSNTFAVNGGTFVGCGGATSYPNAGTQYSLVYSGTVSSNTVVRLANAGGTSIFAFRMPRSYSGSVKLLCGCPGLTSPGTYTVYTGATMTGTPFHGLYTNNVSSASGGTSKGSDSSPTGRYYAVP